MGELKKLQIDDDAILEINNIHDGAFAPLTGFMNSRQYRRVVDEMCLEDGQPWSIPITLEIPESAVSSYGKSEKVLLTSSAGEAIAELLIEDIFRVDLHTDIPKVFGVDTRAHPGVAKERARSVVRVGGPIRKVTTSGETILPEVALSPTATRKYFKEMGWKHVVGFQTRNPPHRAHEHLQRIGLEIADGIFIQPLVGWKQKGDITPTAVVRAYQKQLNEFYPPNRALLGTLRTPMRYAGPREAVFHAIVRRNYGCTHFIVGRDHAGVGGFYEKYASQQLCMSVADLGITILPLAGPFYCKKCDGVVTERTCAHSSEFTFPIAGSDVRKYFSHGNLPPVEVMRPEISELLFQLFKAGTLFI